MPGAVRVSWRQDAEVRASGRQRNLVPQWPTVEQPQPRWRSAAMVRRTWGQYSSLSPSLTHLSHTWNITLSRINCERYIFIKKCVRSFIEVVIMFDYVPHIFVYVYLYNTMFRVTYKILLSISWFSNDLGPKIYSFLTNIIDRLNGLITKNHQKTL